MIGGMDLTRLPTLRPQTPAAPGPARDVSAAQRAFFRAALGQAAEPAAPEPQPIPQAAQPAAAPKAEPERFSRPGSIVDIRV